MSVAVRIAKDCVSVCCEAGSEEVERNEKTLLGAKAVHTRTLCFPVQFKKGTVVYT